MSDLRFTETTRAHACRLARALRWTKIRRRALLLKMQGVEPRQIRAQMGESNCPYYVAETLVDELMEMLSVQRQDGELVPCHGTEPDHELKRLAEVLGSDVRQITHAWARGGNKKALAQAGVMLGQPPYGYCKKGTEMAQVAGEPRHVARAVVAPDEAEVFHFIHDLFIDGESTPGIAVELNEQGYSTRRGGPWTKDTIRDMLRNPVYAGYILYRGSARRNVRSAGELFPGRHEALITWDEFADVQDQMLALRGKRGRWVCPWKGAPGEPDVVRVISL
jgi:hypothetical protein